MRRKRYETITLMIAVCKRLAQKKNKQRQNNIAKIVHLKLCHKFGLVEDVKW